MKTRGTGTKVDSEDASEEPGLTEKRPISAVQGKTDSSTDVVTSEKSQISRVPNNHYQPSAAGSVIEADDGFGGTIFIRLQNIASTTNFGCKLDLKKIALKCRNTEFNPRRFGAVIMRLREPRATALIFSSGKLCVTGLRSLHNVHLACKKFHYIIERVGFQPTPNCEMKVQNIVGTVDVGFPIRLEGLVYAHSAFASYEPELFPGLIYRLLNPRVVFLIFVSGKLVITGAKKESDLSIALTKLFPVLVEFKKEHVASFNGRESAVLEQTRESEPPVRDTISPHNNRVEEV